LECGAKRDDQGKKGLKGTTLKKKRKRREAREGVGRKKKG